MQVMGRRTGESPLTGQGKSLPRLFPLLVAMALAAQARAEGPTIGIRLADEDGWGDAVPADVRAVLDSAAGSLVPLVPDAGSIAIEVHARGGPIALFDRTPEGHFQVRLDTGGNHWAQYGFQFGHELCHVLCRSDRTARTHLWFEEALCETASLFVLRRMADSWQRDPPYRNWAAYAPRLADYAAMRLAESPRPEGMSLARWYERHREDFESQPTDRPNALAVAAALLPLFEAQPERWAAVRWLNVAPPARGRSFARHLAAWRRETPRRHAAAVDAIAAEFGIRLDSPAKPAPLPAAIPAPDALPAATAP